MSAQVQWTTGSGGNGHWYDLTARKGTWTQTDAQATTSGGYLTSVNSAAEQAFLQSAFFPVNREWFWIGLRRSVAHGPFVQWTSGEAVGYTNWARGEPNDCSCSYSGPLGEAYTQMNWHFTVGLAGRGVWNDAADGGGSSVFGVNGPEDAFGVVEYDRDPSVVPEPASMVLVGTGLAGLGVLFRRRRR